MEDSHKFLVIESIQAGWEEVRGVKSAIWGSISIAVLSLFFLKFVCTLLGLGGVILFVLIALIVEVTVFWNLIYLGIQKAASKPTTSSLFDFIFDSGVFWNMIGLSICKGIIAILFGILVGWGMSFAPFLKVIITILGLLAQIFITVRMLFSTALVIDQGVGPLVAIEWSFALTKGNVCRLIAWWLGCAGVVLLSAFAFGVGLVWGIPFIFTAYGVAYKTLKDALPEYGIVR
jgi:uncharacterized membrane protein